MNRISIDNPMLETLKDIDLRATQARLASQIGKQSKQRQIDFLLGELERLQEVARAAITKAEGRSLYENGRAKLPVQA